MMVADRLSFLLVCTDTVWTGSGYFTGHQHNIFHNLFFIHILDAMLLNICYDPMFAAFKSTKDFALLSLLWGACTTQLHTDCKIPQILTLNTFFKKMICMSLLYFTLDLYYCLKVRNINPLPNTMPLIAL